VHFDFRSVISSSPWADNLSTETRSAICWSQKWRHVTERFDSDSTGFLRSNAPSRRSQSRDYAIAAPMRHFRSAPIRIGRPDDASTGSPRAQQQRKAARGTGSRVDFVIVVFLALAIAHSLGQGQADRGDGNPPRSAAGAPAPRTHHNPQSSRIMNHGDASPSTEISQRNNPWPS
jgi:hypothetical protein